MHHPQIAITGDTSGYIILSILLERVRYRYRLSKWNYLCFILHLQTQLEIQRALEEDPTVYEYDSIYDEMDKKKKETVIAKKEKNKEQKVGLSQKTYRVEPR